MVNYILALLVLGLLPIWSFIKVSFSNTLEPEVVFIIKLSSLRLLHWLFPSKLNWHGIPL